MYGKAMQNACNLNGHGERKKKGVTDLFALGGDVLYPCNHLKEAVELFIFSYLKQGWRVAHNRKVHPGLM